MKFFQKILIGLCSLLPCFASVPSGSRGETREIQKRNYQVQAVTNEPTFDVTFLGSDNITSINKTNNLKYIPKIKLKTGVTFQYNLGNNAFGVNFSFAPTKCIWAGVMLYSPLFDGVNYFPKKLGLIIKDDTGKNVANGVSDLGTYHPSLISSVFDFDSVNSKTIQSIQTTIVFNSSLNNIPEEKNLLYRLPILCTSGVFPESVTTDFNSVVSLWLQGLGNGFLQGMQYHKSTEVIDYGGYYNEGYEAGKADGFKTGQIDGMNTGKEIGYKDGYKAGYDIGYSKGSDTLTPFTTITSLFGAVASVPTEILNGMADLSIWNTSILAVLFTLMFLALVLWIIRKFI